MKFRFTLSNSILGSQVINEPDGWKGIKIKLNRHPDYHSIVEVIDTPFFFYNANNLVDGGRNFLTTVESTQGIAAKIGLLIELTEDDITYDEVFTGNLDLSTVKDLSKGQKFYKFQCSIIPDDLWATFLNRKSIAVNLNSTTDIDGNANPAVDQFSLSLPAQIIDRVSRVEIPDFDNPDAFPQGYSFDATNTAANLDLPITIYDEVLSKYQLPTGTFAPTGGGHIGDDLMLFDIEEQGTYDISLDLLVAVPNVLQGYPYNRMNNASSTCVVQYGNLTTKTTTVATKTQMGTNGIDGCTRFEFSVTGVPLVKGDYIRIVFGESAIETVYVVYGGLVIDPHTGISYIRSFIEVSAHTTYDTTTTDSILLYDAADTIINKITDGASNIHSDYLGGHINGYEAQGCAHKFAIMKGLHIRGYTFSEKPFSMSFEDWWGGANPIFNMGLGLKNISGVEYLFIDKKETFYDDNAILQFDNVNNLERTYDQSIIFKSLKFGYNTWSVESASGIDDPQSVHEYSTLYKMIGQDFIMSSSFVAASLAIEQTRRNRKEIGKDWRLDDEIIIIALNSEAGASPEVFTVEVNHSFTAITNLLNPTTRYNIRLTPYRNFLRWIKYVSAAFQVYLSTNFRYNSGEGNVNMVVGANSDTCDTGTWTENQNIAPSSNPYSTHQMYRAEELELSWSDYKLWRANKERALLISDSITGHKTCHIRDGEYDIAEGKLMVNCWIK